jgi:type I restriction enzyme S subunit
MSETVPEGWKKDTLGNLCSSIRGVSYKPEDLRNEKSRQTVTLLRSNNIQEGGIDFNNVQYVGINKVKQKQIMTDGDIAVCMSNGSKRLVGKSATLQSHVISETFTVGAFCSIIRATEKSSHQFVRHLLKSDNYKQQVEFSLAGSAINNLKDGDVENYTFLLPPLPEQKKIASILTSVDEVIETTQKQIDKLQDLKKATMNELLTKGIGHTEFKDSELGRIPKSWEVKQIQEICTVIRGASPRPQGDPRYYGGKVPRLMGSDVSRDGKYVFPKTDFLTREGAKLSRPLKKGSLTVVCSGTPRAVGVPSILGIDACIHDGFLGLTNITAECSVEFLYYNLLPLQGLLDSSATHGGIFTNLTTEIMKEFPIVVPPLCDQIKISEILSSLDSTSSSINQKLSQTQSLKKSLMQDLLTGKVRVQVN